MHRLRPYFAIKPDEPLRRGMAEKCKANDDVDVDVDVSVL